MSRTRASMRAAERRPRPAPARLSVPSVLLVVLLPRIVVEHSIHAGTAVLVTAALLSIVLAPGPPPRIPRAVLVRRP